MVGGRVYALAKVVILSRKGDLSGLLGVDREFDARAVVWGLPSSERCSLARAVAYIFPLSQPNPEVVDPRLDSLSVTEFYDVDLHSEGKWNISDALPSG